MKNQAVRYVMNSISGYIVETALLISICHIWGWWSLFWTALSLTIVQTIGIYTFAERYMHAEG